MEPPYPGCIRSLTIGERYARSRGLPQVRARPDQHHRHHQLQHLHHRQQRRRQLPRLQQRHKAAPLGATVRRFCPTPCPGTAAPPAATLGRIWRNPCGAFRTQNPRRKRLADRMMFTPESTWVTSDTRTCTVVLTVLRPRQIQNQQGRSVWAAPSRSTIPSHQRATHAPEPVMLKVKYRLYCLFLSVRNASTIEHYFIQTYVPLKMWLRVKCVDVRSCLDQLLVPIPIRKARAFLYCLIILQRLY